MIYATGHICGAHMNPAITLAFALSNRFPRRDVPVYWAVQFAAGIAAGLALRGIMGDMGGMGATLPSVDVFRGAAVEFGLTFFLALVVMAVATDSRAEGPGAAFAIGGIVALEIMVAGPVSGASMNPAPLPRPRPWPPSTGKPTGFTGWAPPPEPPPRPYSTASSANLSPAAKRLLPSLLLNPRAHPHPIQSPARTSPWA